MKPIYTLHKLPEGFIVTSDELIKDRDFTLSPTDNKVFQMHKVFVSVDIENYKKVIAQQDQINFSGLSEEEQKRIGWFDLYVEAQNYAISTKSPNREAHRAGYVKGFQKAQELLSDRRFLEDDLKIAMIFGTMRSKLTSKELDDCLPTLVQSLSQPKSWEVELEMEECETHRLDECYSRFQCCENPIKPKLNNGKIIITKIL
jgi:hypothetical protein